MTASLRLLFLPVLTMALYGCAWSGSDGPPVPPDEALSTFDLVDGFRIELVAAEPMVTDPVAMDVDAAGRLYVVEMPGYPLDVGGTGRIKRLEDTDGDGRPDQSRIFADGLTLPTGIMSWKSGVLVTDAPDVLYLEDTDGDGTADRRDVVLTGFALSNPQHNFNNPVYGLDNWVYVANEGAIWWTEAYADEFGDRGSEIRFPDRDDAPRLGRNGLDRNVRFRPDTYEIETLSGSSQFGHTFDAWGRHFLVDNSHPQFHEVIAARYLLRNPDLPVKRAVAYTPAYGNAPNVYPITIDPEHQLLTDRGVFTSATGITYALGGLFPEAYDHVTFVAEPVHNLVHADRVRDDGATFTAERLLEGREFLASTDAWFRPVNFYIGPDGALYVIDYYRQIIEHPEWMDDETNASGNLYNGTDRGRIYRIVPDDTPALDWVDAVNLDAADTPALVEALSNPNIWWRRTAQRLLVDRKPDDAVAPLRALASDGEAAVGRLHALWTLDGLDRLEASLIEQALHDDEPGVRENAVKLAELYLNDAPSLATGVLNLENDPDPKVRFQVLCTLGNLASAEARAARQRLLFRDLEDEWMQIAALSVAPEQGRPSLTAALAEVADRETEGRTTYLRRVATIIGAGAQPDELRAGIRMATTGRAAGDTWWRAAVLEGLADGTDRQDTAQPIPSAGQDLLVATLFETDAAPVRRASLRLLEAVGIPDDAARRKALDRAETLIADRSADPALRADAIRLLALADPQGYTDQFQQTLDPQEPATVQTAALQALRRTEGPAVGHFLLDRWPSMTPDVRTAAIDVFMTEEPRVKLLLDAIEAGTIQPSTVGWQRRVVLMRDWEGALRDQARTLLSEPEEARTAVIERYRPALEAEGDAARGEQVYTRVCSTCHQAGSLGDVEFGPNLATVRHWPPQALLSKILNPNRSVADAYALWFVERRNGETVSGIIAEETPTAVTVRNQGGLEHTIPRSDIRGLSMSDATAMPAGLEQQISVDEMADLLAFLKQN